MKNFAKSALLLAVTASTTAFGAPVTLTYEFNDPSEISGWPVVAGPATVSGGVLQLGPTYAGNGIIELPIDFDRTAGDIKIEADIRLYYDIGDFNIFALYTADPYTFNVNGYDFAYFPDGNDNGATGQTLTTYTGGLSSTVAQAPTFPLGVFTTVSATIKQNGGLVTKQGSVQTSVIDTEHQSGKIALRTWGNVDIDRLTVTYSVQEDTDGDSILDDEDACVNSILTSTIVINGQNTGVVNTVNAVGCSVSDSLDAACGNSASNHGQFVSCMAQATTDMRKAALLTNKERADIMRVVSKK